MIAAVVDRTDMPTLKGFVLGEVVAGAEVGRSTRVSWTPEYQTVKHSVGEYVDGMAGASL